jgi:hypothetical protein
VYLFVIGPMRRMDPALEVRMSTSGTPDRFNLYYGLLCLLIEGEADGNVAMR